MTCDMIHICMYTLLTHSVYNSFIHESGLLILFGNLKNHMVSEKVLSFCSSVCILTKLDLCTKHINDVIPPLRLSRYLSRCVYVTFFQTVEWQSTLDVIK